MLFKANNDINFFRNSVLVNRLDQLSNDILRIAGRIAYCNITSAAGCAWYVNRNGLQQYWRAQAETLAAGNPVFFNETRSTNSPDQCTSFYLDFDGNECLPDSLVHLFVWDVVNLIRRTFVTVLEEIPVAEHCLVFAIKDASRIGFGCHVVMKSVLVDRDQATALSRVAHGIWAETGWASFIHLDMFANSGLRPILSNKIKFYPFVDTRPAPINIGRTYDIFCVFHFRGTSFYQASELDDDVLYNRPWEKLPRYIDFSIDASGFGEDRRVNYRLFP